MKSNGWIALVAAMMVGAPAQAAVVTRSFNVTASKFASFGGETSPFSSLSADVTVSFDPTIGGIIGAPDFFRVVTDGQVNSGAFSAAPLAAYFPDGIFRRSPRIVVGGALNGIDFGMSGTDDFFIGFDVDNLRYGFTTVSFQTTTSRVSFLSTDATVRETTVAAAVPEPATWLMLLAGFGVTGAALRRRRGAARYAR